MSVPTLANHVFCPIANPLVGHSVVNGLETELASPWEQFAKLLENTELLLPISQHSDNSRRLGDAEPSWTPHPSSGGTYQHPTVPAIRQSE